MKYVWEVRATGGAPNEIKVAVAEALERLCAGKGNIPDDVTREAFTDGVIACSVIDTATSEGNTSVIVEVETRDENHKQTAAALSGGFDEEVLDSVLTLEGVTEVSHSDRIARSHS